MLKFISGDAVAKSIGGAAVAAFAALAIGLPAEATQVQVTIENVSPAGGTAVTPVWVGFHNGSFDSYNGGEAAAPELERLAEDGNTAPISGAFGAGQTLSPTGIAAGSGRVQGTLGGGPITPGNSVTQGFDIDVTGDNRYLSYASMVLVSNDYFIANGNPTAHDLSDILSSGSVTFLVGLPGTVNDAGTEVNDFATSAGNGLFAGLGTGQSGPNVGADEGGVITNVANPFANFLNTPPGFDLGLLDFNSYPGGIARVTVTAVPEPTAALLFLAGILGVASRRKIL